MLEKFYQSLFQKRKTVLAVATLLVFLAGWSLSGVRWSENIFDLLPAHQQDIQQSRQLMASLPSLQAVVLAVKANPVADQQKIADTLASRLQSSGYFYRLLYRWKLSDLLRTSQIMRRIWPVLFTARDSLLLSEKITADSIRSSLQDWKRQLAAAPGAMMTERIISDPLNFNSLLTAKINRLQSPAGRITVRSGYLTSSDGRYILLIGLPSLARGDGTADAEFIAFMEETISDVKEHYASAGVEISWLAAQRYSVENARRIKADIQFTVVISLLAISLLALLVYRRPYLILLTLVPALFGTLMALAIMRWLWPELSAIVIGSGAMVLGIAVDYGIHLLFHLDRRASLDFQNRVMVVRGIFRPLLISAGTTLAAFLVLIFSDLAGYQQLGVFVMLGILLALLFVLLVLPLLLPARGQSVRRQAIVSLPAISKSIIGWVQRFKKPVIILLVLLTLLSLAGLPEFSFDADVRHLNAGSRQMEREARVIHDLIGDSELNTTIVVSAADMQVALKKNEQVASVLAKLHSEGVVTGRQSMAELMPSQSTQQQNLDRWQRFWSMEKRRQFKAIFSAICKKEGWRAEVFRPFFDSLTVNADLIDPQVYSNTLVASFRDNLIATRQGGYLIVSTARLKQVDSFGQLQSRFASAGKDIVIYNGLNFVNRIVGYIYREWRELAAAALILVSLLIVNFARNLRRTVILLSPVLLSLLWTFGLMGWLSVPVNLMSALVIILVFGLVIDYSVFLSGAFQSGNPDEVNTSGGAIIISALTTLAGLGALMLAGHPALHALGITAFLGIGTGLLAVLITVPLSSASEAK